MSEPILLGYVLTVLACASVGDTVTHECKSFATRKVPTNQWVCNVKVATAIERVEAVDPQDLGLKPGSYHFEFGCEPVFNQRGSL